MDKDELKKVLCALKDQLIYIKCNLYPLSRDFDWIESAIRIIQTMMSRMAVDEEVTGDAPSD